jgi:serine/threonine protein kinase
MTSANVLPSPCLQGVHPFDLYGNSTDEEIEQQILSGKKPPLRHSPLTAHLSDAAIDVIENLLQWDPKKRLTASQLLENAWVRGETAPTNKIADSDKRLSAYRKFKSTLEARVFADMVALADTAEKSDVDMRTSLIEHAFRRLDPTHKGYVTTADLNNLTKQDPSGTLCDAGGEVEQLSLSGFSDLISDNMKNRYFPKGHVIYKEGEVGHVMYFLESGKSVIVFL